MIYDIESHRKDRISVSEEIRAPKLDSSKCIKCERCVEVCPQDVFSSDGDGSYIVQNPERCIECGACELNCRGNAISIQSFPGCGCIWNATFRRLKSLTFWRKSKPETTESTCCSN